MVHGGPVLENGLKFTTIKVVLLQVEVQSIIRPYD